MELELEQLLTPVINNGQITSVKVIESGIGYSQDSTSITILPSGSCSRISEQKYKRGLSTYLKSIIHH
jgi:hypothetical protein